MKIKNLLLGIFAFVFAVGSAFASTLLVLVPTYVWGKTVENSSEHCIYVGNVCNGQPGNVCKIAVPTTAGTIVPVQVFRDSECKVLMTDSRTNVLPTAPQDQITQIVLKVL